MPAPYPTYHVGDRVIVRQWNDMMEEFGSNPYGDITVHPNKLSFILDMKPYCGKEFIVVKIVHAFTLRLYPRVRICYRFPLPDHRRLLQTEHLHTNSI